MTITHNKDKAEWESRNPVLPSGAYAFESDTGKLKQGDGATPWNGLPYLDVPAYNLPVQSSSLGSADLPERLSESTLRSTYGTKLEVARRRAMSLLLAPQSVMAVPPTIALVKTSTSTITTPKSVSYSGFPSAYRFVGVGPPLNLGGSGFYGNSVTNGVASWFEWSTDAATMDIRLVGLNTAFVLECDGLRIEDVGRSTDASGGAYLYTVTFPTAIPRTFRLFAINQGFNGVYIPATATVWKSAEAKRPLAWAIGDSYAFGTGATQPSRAAVVTLGRLLGLDVLPDGVGSSGWNTIGTHAPVTRVTARLAALTETPEVVILDLGYNDAGGNMITAATAFDAAVAAIRSAVPAAKIVVFGPHTPQGTTANLDAVKSMLVARSAVAAVPFVDVADWINAGNKALYTGGDNVHPTQIGHDYLAARKAQTVSGLLV